MNLLSRTLVIGLVCCSSVWLDAQEQEDGAEPADGDGLETIAPITDEDYEELFRRYMEDAQEELGPVRTARGYGWMTDLSSDNKARRVNDIVTVQVFENVAGSGVANTSLAKNGSGMASLTNFFGIEGRLPAALDPTSLVNNLGQTNHAGSGTTNRTGTLTAVVSARVAEALPNGDLVLEGVREIEINGDRQMLLLTGVIRPEDIGQNNVVSSMSIGQLRIRYFGQGIMQDSMKPGLITKILNKIF